MPIISVIVPVYKVEDYIHVCIDSILNQTFTDFELILVDDGSPDHCGDICDAYAEKDNRIRVVHRENGGLSAARNSGLDIAQGSFISFVDSDDMIHPQMLEMLLNAIQTTDANLSLCFFTRDETELGVLTETNAVEVITGTEGCFRICGWKNGKNQGSEIIANYVTAWGKLIPRELFSNFRFPVGRKHEDEFTTYRLFYESDKIAVLNDRLYYYRPNPSSIMANRGIAEKRDYIDALCERRDYYQLAQEELLLKHTQGTLNFAATEYALLSRSKKRKNDLPETLRVPVIMALRRMKHNCSRESFVQYLEMVYPGLSKLYKRLLCKH